MKFGTKNIKDLSDDELCDAIHSLAHVDKHRVDKLDNHRKRHKRLFDKHPPVENPIFATLINELQSEFLKRKLSTV